MTTVVNGAAVGRPGPRRGPTVNDLHHALGRAARDGAGDRELDDVDVEAAVDAAAAMLAGGHDGQDAARVAEQLGANTAAMGDLELPSSARRPVDWSGFGALIPVLSGSPGAGASALAAGIADALQLAARCVLLIDAADPARSGLAAAAPAEGPWTFPLTAQLAIRYSWRGQALLARLESGLPVITPGMMPPPPRWLPELEPLHVTVVDVGHDGWRATANPLVGAGGWLRRGTPSARPILVVRPTRPSLRHAEQLLARLDPWVSAGAAIPPCQLAVTGAKRWPGGVAGAAGRRLQPLLDDALFIPHDGDLQVAGVTDELMPGRVLDAVAPLLADWGLLPPPGRARSRSRKGQS